jgi:hypothetical protein
LEIGQHLLRARALADNPFPGFNLSFNIRVIADMVGIETFVIAIDATAAGFAAIPVGATQIGIDRDFLNPIVKSPLQIIAKTEYWAGHPLHYSTDIHKRPCLP